MYTMGVDINVRHRCQGQFHSCLEATLIQNHTRHIHLSGKQKTQQIEVVSFESATQERKTRRRIRKRTLSLGGKVPVRKNDVSILGSHSPGARISIS